MKSRSVKDECRSSPSIHPFYQEPPNDELLASNEMSKAVAAQKSNVQTKKRISLQPLTPDRPKKRGVPLDWMKQVEIW